MAAFRRSKFNPAADFRNVSHPALHPRYCHGRISPAQSVTVQSAKCSDRYTVAFNGGLNLLIESVIQRPPTHGRFWKRMPSSLEHEFEPDRFPNP
jgi:hypothetical protein